MPLHVLDNLTNLSDTAIARSNIGLGAEDSPEFYGLTATGDINFVGGVDFTTNIGGEFNLTAPTIDLTSTNGIVNVFSSLNTEGLTSVGSANIQSDVGKVFSSSLGMLFATNGLPCVYSTDGTSAPSPTGLNWRGVLFDDGVSQWKLQEYYDESPNSFWYGGSGSEPENGTWTSPTESPLEVTIISQQNTLNVNNTAGITLNSDDYNSGTVSINGVNGVTIGGGVLNFNSSDFVYLGSGALTHRISLGLGTTDSPTFSGLSVNIINSPDFSITGTVGGELVASKSVAGWAFLNKTTPQLTIDSSPQAVFFKPDGSQMYVLGSGGATTYRVYAYNVPTPWDVSTVSATPTLSSGLIESAMQGLYFSPDGRYFFTLSFTSRILRRFTMSVGYEWNVSTGVASGTFTFPSVSPAMTQLRGITFKPDGTKLYVVEDFTNFVYEYDLNPAWDVTTAVRPAGNPSLALFDGGADISISSDGKRLIIINGSNGSVPNFIFEYILPTPWSLVGAFWNARMFRTTNTTAFPAGGPAVQENTSTGIYYNDTLNKCFFLGTQQRRVQEIDVTPQPAIVGTRPIILSNVANSVADRVTMNSLYITDTTGTVGTTTGALLVAGGIGAGAVNAGSVQSPLIEAVTTDGGVFSLQFRASIRTAGSNNNGFIRLGNQGGTDFDRLILGPFTASYPAIKVDKTVGVVGVEVITATNTSYADLRAANITANNFVVLDNIVTRTNDFTLSGTDAGKYIRLTKPSGTQTIALTGSGILTGHEFTFYRATSAALALSGGTVNGGVNISSVSQNAAFGLKHLGGGTFDFI